MIDRETEKKKDKSKDKKSAVSKREGDSIYHINIYRFFNDNYYHNKNRTFISNIYE